jgi:ketosteroid isomerase-like protein
MFASEISFDLIARRFIDAFNRRDAEGLVALSDPGIAFHPTSLVGKRQRYDGHDGLRRWVAELEKSGLKHQVRVREVHPRGDGFLLLSEVLLDGTLITPSAMIARLSEQHAIVEARAFLTDAELLSQIGVMPGDSLDHA